MTGTRVRVFLTAAVVSALGAATVAACDGGGGGTDPGPQTGSIVGQVSAGGTAVQGAQVALTGGPTLSTAANGQVRFDNVAAGSHTVTLGTLPQGISLGSETAAKSATVVAGGTANVSWSVQAGGGGGQATVVQATSSFTFSPSTVTIPAGGTVRFEWQGGGAHTVTPETPSGSWVERDLASATDNFSVTFDTPGTYRYRCRPHSQSFTTGMVGVITVTAPPESY